MYHLIWCSRPVAIYTLPGKPVRLLPDTVFHRFLHDRYRKNQSDHSVHTRFRFHWLQVRYSQNLLNYTDAKLIAELSEDLGEAMVGINPSEIQIIMEERGK